MRDIQTIQANMKASREQNLALAKECTLVAQGFLLEAQRQGFADPKQLKQAAHYFLKALERHHRHLDAYLGLAFLSALLNQYDKAKQLLEQAKAINPDDKRIAPLEHEVARLIEIGVDPRAEARAMMARLKQKREAAKAEREMPLSKVGSLRSQYEDEDALLERLKKRREQSDVAISGIESVRLLFDTSDQAADCDDDQDYEDDDDDADNLDETGDDALPLQPEDLSEFSAEFEMIDFDGEDD
jgi:tetratricopeptide (TPR) repeat protein